MKNLKELYALLLKQDTDDSICSAIDRLYWLDKVTISECDLLHKHFKSNKPWRMFYIFGKHKKFAKHPSFEGKTWWWHRNSDGNNQRRLFLEHLISLL